MSDEKVDWDALLERRLVESRERQRDEAQAAEPAPGPQAAEQVLEKLRTAAENGQLGEAAPPADADQELFGTPAEGATHSPAARVADEYHVEMPPMQAPAPLPVRPAPARKPSTRRVPPIIYMVPPRHAGEHHHHGSLRRLKQVAFWVLLLAMLLLGMVLTFWPEALKRLGLGGDERPAPNAPPSVLPQDVLPAPPSDAKRSPATPRDDHGPAKSPSQDPPGPEKAPPAGEPPTREPLPKDSPPPPEPAPPAGKTTPAPPPEKEKSPPEPEPASVTEEKPDTAGPFAGPDPSEIKPPAPPEAPKPPTPPTDRDLTDG